MSMSSRKNQNLKKKFLKNWFNSEPKKLPSKNKPKNKPKKLKNKEVKMTI